MGQPRYPSLYQINTRIWFHELSRSLGKPATFDRVADEYLDRLASLGFDWLWPLGVWQTGPAARAVSRTWPDWQGEFKAFLPDLTEDDITGSPFAVQAYTVHRDFGGDESLARFRQRLQQRGLRLLLDFVPNHTAPDHAWVWEHPDYYIGGNEDDLRREPWNYCHVATRLGSRVLAHGRDPYFPGWPDVLQLNYRCLALRRAMTAELIRIAGMCDGVRCDVAMLLLPDVIQRTWGERSLPADGSPPVDVSFWPEVLAAVHRRNPGFLFMAEVYWGLEWTLQQQGFAYTYDKTLYDRLHARDAEAVRGHLLADAEFQRKSVRFLENQDEARAASAFPPEVHKAAAVIGFLTPGLRFFQEGQLEGRRLRAPLHLGRRPAEPLDRTIQEFYVRLLECVKLPAVRDGNWQLLESRLAWEGNLTWKHFLAFAWQGQQGERLLIAVNYGPTAGQCYVQLSFPELPGRQFLLRDRLSPARYERDGTDLAAHGLYLDMPAWQFHIFDLVSL